jgi:hypothetical protein
MLFFASSCDPRPHDLVTGQLVRSAVRGASALGTSGPHDDREKSYQRYLTLHPIWVMIRS